MRGQRASKHGARHVAVDVVSRRRANVSRFSLLMAMNKQAMLAAIDDLALSRTDVDWRLVASIST
jgi:hypothetical protein